MPPKLVILSEQLRGQTFELTNEVYTLGRSEQADICVPDPTISGVHCELVAMGGGEYKVRDGGSTNGTRINGVRVDEQKLVNSDILQVGGVEIMFDTDDQSLTSVLSSQTGINLEETAGGIQLEGIENLNKLSGAGTKDEENAKAKLFFVALIAVLGLIVVILAVVLVMKMTGPS